MGCRVVSEVLYDSRSSCPITSETKLPNIASVLKEEIARVARKALRGETLKLKQASTQHRSDIATLKRRLADLELQVVRSRKARSPVSGPPDLVVPIRFSSKGLTAQRKRLGLSAGDMGLLLGVSGQTVYSWESGESRPRRQNMSAIAAVRKLGRKEASARLGEAAK